jgi:NADPH-dependent ferric siderophore reductase
MATVSAIEMLSPRMKRITLSSPELADFDSPAHDDHVKLFFPPAGGASAEPSARDFTPRLFSRAQQTLAIDFVLHAHGPAATWARSARVGDSLQIGGPRGSTVVADDFDWYLMVGDESALPAIGRRVEELRASVPVTTVVAIENHGEQQSFSTAADWRPHWIERDREGSDDASAMLRILQDIDLGTGDGFVWIAAETTVARTVRRYVLETRRQPAAWLKAAAYWTQGDGRAIESIGEAPAKREP